jgi:long-chain acyl-CoA synthetase
MSYQNLAELHRRQADRLGPRPALRYRRDGIWHDVSWADYREQVAACAAALVDVGVQPGDRVGLLAENRVEWLIADLGLLAAGAVCVPPHAPLTARQVHFQLACTETVWVFVSTQEQLAKVLQVRAELPSLRGIVLFDRAEHAYAVAWPTFLQRGRAAWPRFGRELARREAALGQDDLATIMYTSGTTGDPKGVMLSHGNLLSNAVAAVQCLGQAEDGLLLTWLPLSHIYARLCDHYASIAAGNTIALAPSADCVVESLDELRPTQMSAVPRFYEKLLAAVASSDVAETGRRLREAFGPRVRMLSSGGAPLPRAVLDAYLAAGITLRPGYGLTESSPIISFNSVDRFKPGTVGPALPGVEVRIAADGEILTRGPHVMKGYWKNPRATAEAIRDGWLHTGDLGEIDADGFLTITGRKKELLVLSSGKKVVPSQIEGLLLADPCIDQVIVCGEGRHYLTALVVPNWDNLRRAGVDVDHAPLEERCERSDVIAALRERIDAALAYLAGWEQIKHFAVLRQPFSAAADELTVSLKLRRTVILERNRERIGALYQS